MLKNNRGFSLVQVLIAAGMLGALSLMVVKLSQQTSKVSTKSRFDTDVTLTTNEIVGILSDPERCLNTFETTATPTNIDGKFYINSSGSAPAGGYGNSNLKIVSYELTTSGNDGTLLIKYKNKNLLEGKSGPSTVGRKVNLYVEGSAGDIDHCRTLSSSSTDIWTRGSGEDIYYDGGNVGVGVSAPSSKLDVAGGIKVGNQSDCNADLQGTLRYNSSEKIMQFCNGSEWVIFGVPKREWKDRKSSRSKSGTYTNNTGHEIVISVETKDGNPSSNGCKLEIEVNGKSVARTVNNNKSHAKTCALTVPVPDEGTYRIADCEAYAGGCKLIRWFEYR